MNNGSFETYIHDRKHGLMFLTTISKKVTYLMLGKRSDTIPLKSFKSSTKNFGTFTSRIALSVINSYRKYVCQNNKCVTKMCVMDYNEPQCKKIYLLTSAPTKAQISLCICSLIRVFFVCMKKCCTLCYPKFTQLRF